MGSVATPGRPDRAHGEQLRQESCQGQGPSPDPALPRIAPAPGGLDGARLAALNQRSDAAGFAQIGFHLGLLGFGAGLWSVAIQPTSPWARALPPALHWPVALVGLLLLGWALAFAFCAMHECGHRTAFASRALNDAVAWWAGVLSFYNADFYRRYHQWHHRYTHLPGLDPELEDAPPTTSAAYLRELSGLGWWLGKLRGHLAGLRGDFAGRPYIPADAAPAVRRSLGLQALVYGLLALLSLPGGNGLLFWYWLLPLAVGQPLLRFVLLAEHGGCPFVADGLRNTRTTLTLAPLRRLMWNMPFHAEHHLYPSLPFHALGRAHQQLAPALAELSPGYLAVHRQLLADLPGLALPATPPRN
jgi:fatty acid desaturase